MSRPLNSESVFRAIADPLRRRIIDILLKGERPVGELIVGLKIKPPAASHHLRVLLNAGVVRQRRRGAQRVYALDHRPLLGAHQWLERCVAPSRNA